MSKSSKNKKKLDISGLENIAEQISGLSSKLENELKPLMDFNDLGKSIERLKGAVSDAKEFTNSNTNTTKDEGETCMHDNSWHSNCSDCEELNTIDDIFTLVENTPNDMELGKKIRQIYFCYKNDNADSGVEPTDEQLNLFD